MRQTFFQIFILAFIFIVAFVLEIMPWPNDFQGYRPTWVVLVLLYWALALPDKVSVGTAFVVGIIWDLVVGSILGIHALVLSIAIYIITKNHQILRNLSLWLQSLLVMLYVILIRFMIFFIEDITKVMLIHYIHHHFINEFLFSCFITFRLHHIIQYG